MKDFQQRVIDECNELEEKMNKLIGFMCGDAYANLPAKEQGLLMVQLSHMKCYSGCLRERIDLFTQR